MTTFTATRPGVPVEALEATPSQEPDVADEVWSRLCRELVRAARETLPAAERQVLTLGYFGGHTQSEMAVMTGTPLGTIKSRCLSGLRPLRESLEASGAVGGPDEAGGLEHTTTLAHLASALLSAAPPPELLARIKVRVLAGH